MKATIRTVLVTMAFAAGMPLSAADLPIFDGASETAFKLFVGDKGNWSLAAVTGEDFVSAGKRISLAPGEDANSLRAEWKGRGEGQLYLTKAQPVDLSSYVEAESALVFLVKVDKAPKRQAILRMGCGYPCAGNADMTKVFRALPKGEWVRLSVDLQCFTTQGLDATNVDTPFLLLTEGSMGLELADIRLIEGMRAQAAIRC